MANLLDEFGLRDTAKGASVSGNLLDEFGIRHEPPKADGVVDTLKEGAKSTGRALGSAVRTYTGNGQGIADNALEQQQAPRDERLVKFQQDFAERTDALGDDPGVLDTIGEGIGAIADNPAGAGLAVLEQLPNAAVSLGAGWAGLKAGGAAGAGIGSVVPGVGTVAGGTVGGILGGLAGMFLGNAALETGNKAMGMADDGEVTPEEMAQARSEGAIKGGVITGIDALTLGVGGKVASTLQRTSTTAIEAATRKALVDRGIDIADEAAVLAARSNPEIAGAVRVAQENARKATDKLGKRLAVGGTVLGLETVGEGVGEYLGELAATGEGNVPDAVLESLLSLGQSGAETAWNMARTSPANLVQPAPTAENPAPAPVPRPDPSAGSISRAAAMLPAPERLALPAPDQILYADSEGQVSQQGPLRDVDREQRPVPGRAERGMGGGPGMDQQTPRGVLSIAGDLLPAERARSAAATTPAATIYEGELVRPALADMRPEALIVDSQGEARPGRVPNIQPPAADAGGDGMTEQARPVQRPAFDQILQRARQGAVTPDALVAEMGATRVQAARAVREAQVEQSTMAAVYRGVPAANKALRGLARAGEFEVVKAGPREWRIQRRQEVQDADRGRGAADERAAGDLPTAPTPADLVAGGAAVAERPAATVPAREPGGTGAPAADEGADGQRALTEAGEKPAVAGRKIDKEWSEFSQESGTLGIPRAEMPQIKAEHRGAMVNFLNARGIAHSEQTVQADRLKPTQAEFSRKKVRKAKAFKGGDRSILISSDDHVLDGHHQWMARRDAGEVVKVIRLDAPIADLLPAVAEFPSATQDDGAGAAAVRSEVTPTKEPVAAANADEKTSPEELPDILSMSRKRYIERQAKADGLRKGSPGYDQAIRRLQDQYEADVDRASAGLTFEQYNTLNSDSPEGVNRQAWAALRKEFVGAARGQSDMLTQPKYSRGSYGDNPAPTSVDQVLAGWKQLGVDGALIERGDIVTVSKIVSPAAGSGLGTQAMQMLARYADSAGKHIVLSPSGDFGGNKARLTGFYKRFGFVENKGRNRIFQTMESMYRLAPGKVLYSRPPREPEGHGGKAAPLRLQLSRLIGGWQNAPEVKVVQSVKDLPDAQRRRVERDGAFDVEGIFADGKVYLVADNLRDVKHAAFVLQHEVLGHAGLQGAYGKRLTPLLMSLYKGNKELRQQADALVRKFGYQPAEAMEEVLADLAAAGTLKDQPFWSRLVTAMRNALRSIGMNLNWSEGDIQALLANARRYIERGKKGGRGRTVFSRTGDSGRMVEMVDDKGRLLAPNGKPSNLNQKQWHQARSDNFKRWFGDWQALEAQERLDAMKPLKLRTPEAWKGLSERERLAKVEATLKSMARLSEALPHSDLGEVTMSMSGAKKASSSAADPAKQAILARLQSAFEHSIYASGSIDQKAPTVTAYHKLLAPIDVDGVPLVAVFTVREDANGRMFYNTVAVDRKEEAPAVSPGDVSDNAQRSAPANARAPADFVRRPLSRVNPGDVSKVTDGNGEPLVLYHGTAEEFSVFEQGRAGRSTGHATAPLGIFMTTDREVAKAYAEKATDGMPGLANVMPLFASIKKPYRMSLAESQALDTAEAAMAFRQKLEREGFDGIQLGDTGVWVAFYNTQVKSATRNTGAFDEIDPDIRYSRAGQRDIEALRKLGLAGGDAKNLLDQVRNLTLGGLQQKLQEWSVRSEEGLFDGLAGIKRAEQSVGVTDPNRQGYVSARLASGIADVMHGVLHYAAPEWRDGIVSGKAGTRGVLDVLGDLGADNLTPWLAWLGGKRGQLLKAQGRENNLTDADIAELLAMGKGKEELFEKVYRDYAQVNEAVLDLAQEAGLIDQDARAKWLTDYYVPFYRQDEAEGIFTAPRTNRGLSHQTAAIKALKGGKLPTSDLLANMLAGWTKRIDASMKNKALLEVVDNLKGSDFIADESPRWQQVLVSRDQIAQQIRKDRKALQLAADMLDLPAGSSALKVINKLMKPESEGFEQLWTRVEPTEPDIIRVQRAGKNEYYRVKDESLLRGLRFVEGSVFNDPITKIGRAFKRLLTTGVTASPDFILRNFIRDAAHAWMINKDGFTLGKDSIKGMRDALREDQDYRDLMFAGGSFQGGYVHGTDPEASAQIIRRALEKKGFTARQQEAYLASLVNTPAKAAAMLGKGWQKYRELGDKVENANRLSTYKAARAAGKSRRQASFEAKDLMDYSLRGNFAAAQWFTDVVPFLNARLQGLYKLGRAVKGDKTLLAKEVAMKGAYITLFSLLLAGINDDDERYQALQDWDKDMHWHIFLGDEHFRIPKPFELGLLFGTVPERMLHTLTGSQSGSDLGKAVAQGVFQTLAFNPVPQFYQPIRELQANRNFFRDSPIEDMSDEGKLPEARYDERTSAIGKVLGQVTGPTIGLSPKQIDHLVQGYTGTIGGYVLGLSSLVAAGLTEGEGPAWRAADLPVAKVMYQGDAPRTSKYQAQFFDMLTEADQLHRTLKSYREEGRLEAAADLLESSSEKLRHRPALGLARRQLGNIRNQMDAVYRDKVMSSEEKRLRLDELQRRANEVAERVVKRAGAAF